VASVIHPHHRHQKQAITSSLLPRMGAMEKGRLYVWQSG